MLTEVREPFSTMIRYKDHPTNWRWRDAFRTFDWKSISIGISKFQSFVAD